MLSCLAVIKPEKPARRSWPIVVPSATTSTLHMGATRASGSCCNMGWHARMTQGLQTMSFSRHNLLAMLLSNADPQDGRSNPPPVCHRRHEHDQVQHRADAVPEPERTDSDCQPAHAPATIAVCMKKSDWLGTLNVMSRQPRLHCAPFGKGLVPLADGVVVTLRRVLQLVPLQHDARGVRLNSQPVCE
jgi:hypothetical protein